LDDGGSALSISGNVSDGIFLSQRFEPSLDDEGNQAINDDGEPIFNPIAVGLIADITDPTDPDFDEDLQFGFINQGTVIANGVFDDFDATALSFANVTVDGGISNEGNLTAQTFKSSDC